MLQFFIDNIFAMFGGQSVYLMDTIFQEDQSSIP